MIKRWLAMFALLGVALAVPAGPAVADDAVVVSLPAPAIGAKPVVVAKLTGELLPGDKSFKVTLRYDGTAIASYKPLGSERSEKYRGRWRTDPLSVRLARTRKAAAAGSASLAPERIDLRGEPEGSYGVRFDRRSWRGGVALEVERGKKELPQGSGRKAEDSARAAFEVKVEALYTPIRNGALFGTFEVTNLGDRVIGGVEVEVEPGVDASSLPGGEAPPAVWGGTAPLRLESGETGRAVDVPLGAVPEQLVPHLAPQGAAARALRVIPPAKDRGTTRLDEGQTVSALAEGVNVLFAWRTRDDAHLVYVRNDGEVPLTDIVLAVAYKDGVGRVLERLPLPLEEPLLVGEARLLDSVRTTPRGARSERYALINLEQAFVTPLRAYPAKGEAASAERLGGSAEKAYEAIGVSGLKIDKQSAPPLFTFNVENRGETPLEGLRVVLAGADFNHKLMAMILVPPIGALQPGEVREVYLEATAVHGIAGAVYTWSVVPASVTVADAGDEDDEDTDESEDD
ncbi:MAG: hypothetical protein ACYTFT_03290 [Planctomycetota bacterium]